MSKPLRSDTRILALDTTGRAGSVAAFVGDKLLWELELNRNQRSAQSLAPGIKELLARVGWKPPDVELLTLPSGPGSFTGLRIGVMTAKTFAYAVDAAIVGLNTLEVIAARAPEDFDQVEVLMDAQRQQLFTQTFERDSHGVWQAIRPIELQTVDAWLAGSNRTLAITGPLLARFSPAQLEGRRLVDRALWDPTAGVTGLLGARRFAEGRRDDLWTLAPKYYRQSAAEEKAALNAEATKASAADNA